jgi:adenylate kinase
LEVEEKELMERLKLRGQESGRSDDNEKTVKNRLRLYSEQTRPLLDFYARQKRLISVNGQGTIEEVFQLLRNQIK